MHILITNDDGWQAPGLLTLAEAARPLAKRLSICAPIENQSGTGHQITYRKPLIVSPVKLPHSDRAYAVDGTPCDCVRLALGGLFDEPPDLVLSGINHGANLGHDVHYSGTVSAAVEAAASYVAAIAVSRHVTVWERNELFEDHAEVAAYLTDLLRRIINTNDVPATGNADPLLLNINLPNVPPAKFAGLRYTMHAGTWEAERFEPRESPQGILYYWRHRDRDSSHVHQHIPAGLSDTEAVREKYVSVTPMHANRTDRAALDELQRKIPTEAIGTPASDATQGT